MANKNQKYGRNKRSASSKTQQYRTEANKKRRIAREAKRQETPKQMRVHRGTMRKYKRSNVTNTQENTTWAS